MAPCVWTLYEQGHVFAVAVVDVVDFVVGVLESNTRSEHKIDELRQLLEMGSWEPSRFAEVGKWQTSLVLNPLCVQPPRWT